MSNVKNYKEQGGDKWVIKGTLEVAEDGQIILDGKEITPIKGQGDSDASSVATLKTDFNNLLERLFASGLMVVDKSVLIDTIASAAELLNDAVVGTDPGEYPQEAYNTFSAAIDTAQDVVDDEDATQNTVNSAITTLETAITTFENAEVD